MRSLSSFMKYMDDVHPSEHLMPALFIGHGNPMNAIENNEYSRSWAELGKRLPTPKTIHDFGGFPKQLFDQQYPAPGSQDFAELTRKLITKTTVLADYEWGLDHGTWSFLLPMYPKADIPVYQLSLDYYKPMQYHYELARELGEFRKKGVLITGSGNIVHNLGLMNFSGKTYDWATEFDEIIKTFLLDQNHRGIVEYDKAGIAARMSVPTPDHYLPLIYTVALQQKNELISFFNEKTEMGSVSMRSFVLST